MSPMSQAAQNLNWLITTLVDNTPGCPTRWWSPPTDSFWRCPKGSPRPRRPAGGRRFGSDLVDRGRVPHLRGWRGEPDSRGDGARIPLHHVHFLMVLLSPSLHTPRRTLVSLGTRWHFLSTRAGTVLDALTCVRSFRKPLSTSRQRAASRPVAVQRFGTRLHSDGAQRSRRRSTCLRSATPPSGLVGSGRPTAPARARQAWVVVKTGLQNRYNFLHAEPRPADRQRVRTTSRPRRASSLRSPSRVLTRVPRLLRRTIPWCASYAMTGGRTRPRYQLAIEALVHHHAREPHQLQVGQLPEHQRICNLCREIKSVAEISALL